MSAQTFSKALLFWLLWTLATSVGALGLGLMWLVSIPFVTANAWLIFIVVIPVLTMLIGMTQWLVLRWWLPHTAWWIPASIPGGLILLAIAMYDRTDMYTWQALPQFFTYVLPFNLLLLTCFVGLVAGYCQWLVLRHRVEGARWWLLVSVLCLGIGWPFGEAVGEVLSGVNSTLWPVVLSWAITGFLSGIPLAWLVVRSRRVQPAGAIS